MKGKVKFFNVARGFGFISADDGKEYFVHITGIAKDVQLAENDAVQFDVEQGERGPKAVNVKKGGEEKDDEESKDEN